MSGRGGKLQIFNVIFTFILKVPLGLPTVNDVHSRGFQPIKSVQPPQISAYGGEFYTVICCFAFAPALLKMASRRFRAELATYQLSTVPRVWGVERWDLGNVQKKREKMT